MHSFINIRSLSRLTVFRFFLLIALHLLPAVYGFAIDVPSIVTVSETTTFNYSWSQNDTRRDIGIALFDSRNPGLVNGTGPPEDNRFRRLDGAEGRGSIELAVKRTGSFYLQAYSFDPDNKGRPKDIQPVVKSNIFEVGLPNPTTTISVSVLVSSTPSTSTPASQNQSGEYHRERQIPPGAIAGIVIGVVVFLLLIAAAVFLYRRRRYRQKVANFHRDRMIARSAPASQMSFWVGETKSFGGSSVASPRSFGPGFGAGSPSPAPFIERDNLQFPSRDGRLTPLRGAGYSPS